jgi:hypothetical protein
VPALDKRAEAATPTMSRINSNHGI